MDVTLSNLRARLSEGVDAPAPEGRFFSTIGVFQRATFLAWTPPLPWNNALPRASSAESNVYRGQ